MTTFTATQIAEQNQRYGMSIEEMRKDLTDQASLAGKNMLVQSILSDAQEVMSRGDYVTANRFINKAKWALASLAETEMDRWLASRREG